MREKQHRVQIGLLPRQSDIELRKGVEQLVKLELKGFCWTNHLLDFPSPRDSKTGRQERSSRIKN